MMMGVEEDCVGFGRRKAEFCAQVRKVELLVGG